MGLGLTLRRLRTRHRMSVRTLAARAGLTPGAISQLESGAIQPSITTLRRLAAALGEPVFRFFLPEDAERGMLVRRGDRGVLALPNSQARYELLTPGLGGHLEVLELRLPPRGASADAPLGHPGQECMVVIRGRARLELDDTAYLLGPGDAITYPGLLPHRVINLGRGVLVAISAITPPSF
jgi:transcriptional regulator with XRE-family HTH domain